MLEGIALTLIKTLASFIFNQYLVSTQTIEIDGAPNWYYQSESEKICSFSVIDGDYRNINRLKIDLLHNLQLELKTLNDKAIYQTLNNIESEFDKNVLKEFRHNRELNDFIRFNIKYSKIVYQDDINRVFGKSCINKNLVLHFNQTRLQKIVQRISVHKADVQFQEMKTGHSENRYFQELEAGF